MAKKFDTNPLEPDFPAKVKKTKTQPLHSKAGATRAFKDPVETEQQTRKLRDSELNGQNSAPDPASTPIAPFVDDSAKKRKHSIGSISLPENVLLALPYIPFAWIGLIVGIIQLIFIPRTEPRVRYHAAQGVAAHLGIALVTMILGFVAAFSDFADTASDIFSIVTTIVLIVFAFKAWQGKPIHIETVESLTDWLEERISPQK